MSTEPTELNGTDGEDGDSAYQIWLDAGNTGDVDDFLDSLVGPKGEDGTSVQLKGSVADLAGLNAIVDPEPGDLWVVVDDGTGTPNNAYVYDEDTDDWVLVGLSKDQKVLQVLTVSQL